jgi:hypothetical protein
MAVENIYEWPGDEDYEITNSHVLSIENYWY